MFRSLLGLRVRGLGRSSSRGYRRRHYLYD